MVDGRGTHRLSPWLRVAAMRTVAATDHARACQMIVVRFAEARIIRALRALALPQREQPVVNPGPLCLANLEAHRRIFKEIERQRQVTALERVQRVG